MHRNTEKPASTWPKDKVTAAWSTEHNYSNYQNLNPPNSWHRQLNSEDKQHEGRAVPISCTNIVYLSLLFFHPRCLLLTLKITPHTEKVGKLPTHKTINRTRFMYNPQSEMSDRGFKTTSSSSFSSLEWKKTSPVFSHSKRSLCLYSKTLKMHCGFYNHGWCFPAPSLRALSLFRL
jgi:hypothetical protein